jgi:TP901 family phage tail tape measure protein
VAGKSIEVKILGNATGSGGLIPALEESGSALGTFGKFAVGAGAALGTLAVGAGVALAKIGDDFDGAYDNIRLTTGATGEALEGLKDSFRNVSTSVAGVDFETVSTALADVAQRTGLTGPALESLSSQFLQLSKITGGDVATSVADITRVFGDWGIAADDQAGTMDKLWRASQVTGAGVDQLSAQVVQFGAPLRQLGFSFEDSIAMLGKWEKEGVNTELVLGGMKKALSTFAKEGEDAPTALARLTEEIKNIQDPTVATARAMEVFGAKAGPDMAAAIREGRFDIAAYVDAIANGTDTIQGAATDTDDWREKLQLLKNKVFVALEPLATRVFGAIGTGVELATQAFSAFSGAFTAADGDVTSSGFNGFMEKAGFLARQVVDTIVAYWPKVQETISAVVAAVVAKVQAWWPTIASVVSTVFNAVQTAVGFVVTTIIPALVGAFQSTVAFIQETWPKVAEVFSSVWGWIQTNVMPVVSSIFDTMRLLVTTVAEFFATHWEAIKQTVTLVAEVLGTVIGAAFLAVKWAVENVLLPAIQLASEFIAAAIPVIAAIVEGLGTVISWVIDGIKWAVENVFKPAFEAVAPYVQAAADKVGPIMTTIGEWISTLANGAKTVFDEVLLPSWVTVSDAVQTAWDLIKPVLEDIGTAFETMGDVAKGAFEGVVSALKTAWNAVAKTWNSTVGSFSFSIPDWVPTFGGNGFDMPDMPVLHSGGIVPGRAGEDVPTLLQAGEGVFTRDQMAAMGGGAGISIGTINVTDGRSIHSELQLIDALYGYAA